MNQLDTIKTHCFSCVHKDRSPHPRFRVNHFLYFFQIFKELHTINGESCPVDLGPRCRFHNSLFFRFLPPTRPQSCWWRLTGSNRRPPACKAGALPAELNPPLNFDSLRDTALLHSLCTAAVHGAVSRLVSLGSQTLIPSTSGIWWVWLDSNQRPLRYQHNALTS